MGRTQPVAALLVCAVIGLPRAGSAQTAAQTPRINGAGPVPLVVEDSGPPHTTALGYQALGSNTTGDSNTAS
jgi:hypothetical protein